MPASILTPLSMKPVTPAGPPNLVAVSVATGVNVKSAETSMAAMVLGLFGLGNVPVS